MNSRHNFYTKANVDTKLSLPGWAYLTAPTLRNDKKCVSVIAYLWHFIVSALRYFKVTCSSDKSFSVQLSERKLQMQTTRSEERPRLPRMQCVVQNYSTRVPFSEHITFWEKFVLEVFFARQPRNIPRWPFQRLTLLKRLPHTQLYYVSVKQKFFCQLLWKKKKDVASKNLSLYLFFYITFAAP